MINNYPAAYNEPLLNASLPKIIRCEIISMVWTSINRLA